MELGEAIRFYCRDIGARVGIGIRVSREALSFHLTERVKEQCYLCFQEALSNAVKHAKAGQIEVCLESLKPGSLSLRISDDGVGFDRGKAFARPAGLGLAMIRERAESIGGHAQIQSTPGEGTTVTIGIPVGKGASQCQSA